MLRAQLMVRFTQSDRLSCWRLSEGHLIPGLNLGVLKIFSNSVSWSRGVAATASATEFARTERASVSETSKARNARNLALLPTQHSTNLSSNANPLVYQTNITSQELDARTATETV